MKNFDVNETNLGEFPLPRLAARLQQFEAELESVKHQFPEFAEHISVLETQIDKLKDKLRTKPD